MVTGWWAYKSGLFVKVSIIRHESLVDVVSSKTRDN